ncbi:hypothetical protein C8R46DRAFT_1223984 [Mycena filopes]|nr:hypothetical protein C8R46DRAFT_1223984 [Mycena filopes]
MSRFYPPRPTPDVILRTRADYLHSYKVILIKNSPVFRAIFARAAVTGVPYFAGLPVISIDDDPAEMGAVHDALTDRTFFRHRTEAFSLVSVMFRLGNKYRIEELFELALGRLEHDFPPTLAEYQALHGQSPSGVTEDRMIKYSPSLPFDVVALALKYGMYHLLPAAFYGCISIHEGSLEVRRAIQSGVPRDDEFNPSTAEFSDSLKALCLRGLERVLDAQQTTSFRFFHEPAATRRRFCRNPKRCSAEIQAFHEFSRQPSLPVMALSKLDPANPVLCRGCAAAAATSHRRGQAFFWANILPAAFDLPGWEDLGGEFNDRLYGGFGY